VVPSREGVTQLAEETGKAKRVPAGALLMSFKLTIGRTAFAGCDLFPNEAIVWIECFPGADVSEEFLHVYLPHHDFSASVGVAVKGKTLNKKTMAALQVPIPPLEVQRRITNLVAQFDVTIERARAYLSSSDRLLATAREELLVHDADAHVELGKLLTGLQVGKSPRCIERPPLPGEWGVLKVSAVQPGRFVPAESKTLPEGVEPHLASAVRENDVLMTRASGTIQRVGAVCRIDTPVANLLLSDLTFRLTTDVTAVDPEFLVAALCSKAARRHVESRAVGSATMKKVNGGIIRSLSIPLPALDRQRDIVRELQAYEAARSAADRELAALRHAKEAIVQRLVTEEHQIPVSYDKFLERESRVLDLAVA
jgi:type I restriction enzyme S subunit